jgi:peptide deformylase
LADPFKAGGIPLKIVAYPHPSLRQPARPVTFVDKNLRLLIGRMTELMYEARGLGLAAPQVAFPFQLLVLNLTGDPRQPDREETYLNPRIVARRGLYTAEEGCLSFPGLFAKVRRAQEVTIQALDLDGNEVMLTATDLAARAWQHEIDHLNGVLFVDHFSFLARLLRRREIKAFEEEFHAARAEGLLPPEADLANFLESLEDERDAFVGEDLGETAST